MNKPVEDDLKEAVDTIQERLTRYACELHYDALPPEAVHAAKVRVIDILGALIGGFFGEPCRIARNLAAQMPHPDGATVIGTRMKTTLDIAAFVNATTARSSEMVDSYHWPGSSHGHAGETLTPLLGVAEHAQASGQEFITSAVLSYEVFLRVSDIFRNPALDSTNYGSLSTALAAGKLLGLTANQLSHAISMAIVPNIILKQVRKDRLSMFKAVASGQASRAGVFAAMLARAGMEGPHLPFEGQAGWCEHVARARLALDTLGDKGTPLKVLATQIKIRPSEGNAISCILAAEKVAPLKNIEDVKQITVEVPKYAKDAVGTGDHAWHPRSKEDAEYSAPYLVAATLLDGTVTPRSYNQAHLSNRELRALMQKMEVVENKEFTQAYERLPQEHLTRVTVVTASGERLVGEAGGDQDDMSTPKTDAQIEAKFRGLTEDVLGAKRASAILDRLWHLEEIGNVAEIPPAFVLG